ncbi:MAG: MoaD/ThiS family protein, partial [Treponema sp.]|nr:MoaD/ThiS family protein [Treponema sp.]
MQVRFFAYIRNFTGCAEADIPCQETAGALAHSLCERYGSKLQQKFFPSDKEDTFGPEIIVLINGRHVCHLGGVNAPLLPDDRVDIFPVVAGG